MSQTVETKIELALDQLVRVREDIRLVDAKFEKLEKKIDDNYPTRREILELDARISKLEGNQSWLVRAIGGSILSAAIGLFFALRQ